MRALLIPNARIRTIVSCSAQPARAMSKPSLHYFPVRGRAEVMRLALSLAGVSYDEVPVDRTQMKTNPELYPFGQCPRYVDGDIDLVQSNSILRFIGRKYGLMGATEKEHCMADMVMEGVESLRNVYLNLIYVDALAPEAKTRYIQTHLEQSSMTERNKGAHMGYLAAFLSRSPSGYVAHTQQPTLGDLCLWEVLDVHVRIPEFKEKIAAQYPELMVLHGKIESLPPIQAYLPKRPSQVNGNALG